MGLREIERDIELRAKMRKKSPEYMIKELELILKSYKDLREQVKEFEKKYGNLIVENPEYQDKLKEIRVEIGLSEIQSEDFKIKPSSIEKITGKGTFYNQLGIQILNMAKKKIIETGGIMTLAEVVLRINEGRPTGTVSALDVVRAINILEKAEVIPGIKKLESGIKIVEFIPVELTPDQGIILNMASSKGFITLEEIIMNTNWTQDRIERVLQTLLEKNIAKIDQSYATGKKYYFPGLGG
ncbi:MAG: EAP30/Vps36 family vacuolar-sorting protein [Candidatus Helarchaeota archaeon]